jgi:hypothetical protein
MEANMACLARVSDFHGASPLTAARTPATPARRGFWRAAIDAIVRSHRNKTQRDIEAYVARRGKLTDSMEREIADRYMTGHWGSRL